MQLKPVKLRSGYRVNLLPGEILSLQGKINNSNDVDINVLARSSEFLPEGLEIRKTGINDKNVVLEVANTSTNQISLRDDIIFAELSTKGQTQSFVCEALVGPCLEFNVIVENVYTKGLIDSGSQITVLSQSWVKDNLQCEILTLPEELTIVGAGGHQVPYLGYVPVTIELPESLTGVKGSVDVLALVCPDTNLSKKSSGSHWYQYIQTLC